ncbi:sulfotransferase family protein [Salegentibacter maritimus]|uniref:sulfotransferase family protein n=1 Tax=Salegentibacter maritimus TaxID=2794347 RepID=UPI0018E49590|nr:sulfotransferase [Salegentibacter maritimus]MBI6117342.1 sulfotransferase [Salegentibacter maritimus]
MTKLEFLHRTTARLRYNRIWMELLNQTGRVIKNKKWIFISGCYNSGTTLLDQILATHPEISGLPDEGVMLTDKLVRPEDFNWRRMWSECEDDIKELAPFDEKDANRIKKHWSHFYDFKKDFFIEKSISNQIRLKFFDTNFLPSWFIHIVRNGYAVAEGIHRKAEVMEENEYYNLGSYPYSLCAKQWVRSLEVFEKEQKRLQNVITISYEELAENPSKTINTILDKIGLERFADDYFDKSFNIHEKQSKIRNMNASSFNRLKKEDYKAINEIAKETMLNYGYEIREK